MNDSELFWKYQTWKSVIGAKEKYFSILDSGDPARSGRLAKSGNILD